MDPVRIVAITTLKQPIDLYRVNIIFDYIDILYTYIFRQPNGDWRSIAFASRAFTPVEERRRQIERKSLPIPIDIICFKLHIYEIDFKVKTENTGRTFSSSITSPRWV